MASIIIACRIKNAVPPGPCVLFPIPHRLVEAGGCEVLALADADGTRHNGGLKREREDEEEQQHGAPAPPMASRRPRLDPPTLEPPPVRGRPLAPGRTADVIRFLEVLQRELAGKPDKLNEMATILLQYYYMRIDMANLVGRMQIVLQGYPNLIRGFNTFLSRGYALKLDDQQGGGAGDA